MIITYIALSEALRLCMCPINKGINIYMLFVLVFIAFYILQNTT